MGRKGKPRDDDDSAGGGGVPAPPLNATELPEHPELPEQTVEHQCTRAMPRWPGGATCDDLENRMTAD